MLKKLRIVLDNYCYGIRQPYVKWACEELWEYVQNFDNIPMAIDNFRIKMQNYACEKGPGKDLFSTAEYMAENVLDYIMEVE